MESRRDMIDSSSLTASTNIGLSDSSLVRTRMASPSPSPSCTCRHSTTSMLPRRSVEDKLEIPRSQAVPSDVIVVPAPIIATPLHDLVQPSPGTAVHHGDLAGPLRNLNEELTLKPVSPEYLLGLRYGNRYQRPRHGHPKVDTIPSMQRSFMHEDLSSGWTHCAHPEGQLYFWLKQHNMYTDNYLYDAANEAEIAKFAAYLISLMKPYRGDLPRDLEIALHIDDDDSGVKQWCYYLASEAERSIFWLEETSPEIFTNHARSVQDESHLKDAQEAQFWVHAGMFPNHRHVTRKLLDEAIELANFNTFDSKTSATSTSPWDFNDMSDLSNTLAKIKPGRHKGPSFWIIARIMYSFKWERFLNFHGQREARLDRQQTVHSEPSGGRSFTFSIISMLLFKWPDDYMGQIEKLWVDNTVNYQPWKVFVTGLQRDWESSITPTTMLLTANVGLLAIQSIDTNRPARSVAQIASYISTFLSLGNIIVCTILSRQHRSRNGADEAAEYLGKRSERLLGLELLAIILSLPGALFLWGMVTFYLAMAWVCLAGTNLWTRLFSATVFALVSLLVLVVVTADLEMEPKHPSLRVRLFAILKQTAICLLRPQKATTGTSKPWSLRWMKYPSFRSRRRDTNVDIYNLP